jgi:hypothetical protein
MSRFDNETHVPAPTGKQTVRGTVISTKANKGDFGTTYRMTVKVETGAGVYLVNSTIPAAIFDACEDALTNTNGWIHELRGCEVEFSATLERSDSAHFAFAKRPTKATIVAVPCEKARRFQPWRDEPAAETPAEDPFAIFDNAAA